MLSMAETFKCGDIADIINKSNKKHKKQNNSKLHQIFDEMIEENKNKVIKIENINESVDEVESENEILDNNNNEMDLESDSQIGSQMNVRNKVKKRKDSSEKTERTLFVGNLPISTSPKTLKKMFKDFGKIVSVRLRGAAPIKEKMTKKVAIITKSLHSGKDNIHAYIVFKSADHLMSALQLNGSELKGHRIRVDKASNRKEHDQTRAVFLGNLPFAVKEDELYEFFKECGDIEAVRVVRDANTGIGKGFGFISFNSKDSVVLALEKNEQQFKGRKMRVIRAKTESKPNNGIQFNINPKKEKNHSQKSVKNIKNVSKNVSKSQFEGLSAKKIKLKTNVKKSMNTIKSKKKQKKLAEILSR